MRLYPLSMVSHTQGQNVSARHMSDCAYMCMMNHMWPLVPVCFCHWQCVPAVPYLAGCMAGLHSAKQVPMLSLFFYELWGMGAHCLTGQLTCSLIPPYSFPGDPLLSNTFTEAGSISIVGPAGPPGPLGPIGKSPQCNPWFRLAK